MRSWIIVVASLVAPAPAFTQNLNVESDRSAASTHYQTYAWTAGTPAAVVDLYDARTKQLMWRGTGTDMSSDKPDEKTAKTNKAVAKMFEQYPPTQK